MTGFEQSLVKKIVATAKEAYLADIQNRNTNSININMADMFNHPQKNYSQLMPKKILGCKKIIKKMTYHPRDPIATVFYAVEELLEFADITGISYNQHQAVNITYMIIHSMGKFGLEIHEWNFMSKV